MRVTRFRFALLVAGAAFSLRCNAEDADLQGGGSPSLLDPPNVHIEMMDGREKFYELFHFSDAAQITYNVTADIPPNPIAANALDKSSSTIANVRGIDRQAEGHAIAQRIRQGFHDTYTYTFYISDKPTPHFMCEKVSGNEWDKGYIQRTYFTAYHITEILPRSKTVNIWLPDDTSHKIALALCFPALQSFLGIIPERVEMPSVPSPAPYFLVHLPKHPLALTYFVDTNQSLVRMEETTFPHKKLEIAQFKYSAQSHLWPTNIISDATQTDGTPIRHAEWDLSGIAKLPDGFDFDPNIPDDYRVVYKTSSGLSN
jgi:hypothetical protein